MFFLNWAAWSLSVEAFFYVLFPFFAPRFRTLSTRSLFLVATVAYAVGFVAPVCYLLANPDGLSAPLYLPDQQVWSWYLKFFPLCHVHEFLLGAVAGALFVRHEEQISRFVVRRPDVLAIATLAPTVLAASASRHIPFPLLHNALLPPVFAAMLVVLGCGHGMLARALSTRPLVLLGRASYALYILQVPVVYLSGKWIATPSTGMGTAALLLGLVAISVLAHLLIEEPARRALRGDRRAPPASAGDHVEASQ